ncbi:MAG: TIGR00270 family protein [bacterium]|nr:TIGR00270 family protein [bacterium]
MICEMCGAEADVKAIVEDTELTVCESCSKFGKITGKVKKPEEIKEEQRAVFRRPEKEIIQVIVEDYAERIRSKREKLGLKQKDFAKSISEKESLIHKMETGSFEPDLDLARKLERFLRISLVEQHEETLEKGTTTTDEGLTLGDFVKVRKR